MKTIRKTLRFSLIILALLVIALLAAPFLIDVNDYKQRIEHEVEDATGRQLRIGAIHASLFPWVGVRLEDVHLANREGFSAHDFLSLEQLHIKLALLPLINRKVEIKRFEIVGPRLYLEKHRDGRNNWSDLIATAEPAHAAGDTGPAAPQTAEAKKEEATPPILAALQAESLLLHKGELIWVDQASGKPLTLSDIDLALNDVQLSRPISISLSANLRGSRIAFHGQAGPLGDLSKLDPAKLPAKGELKAEKIRLADFQEYLAGWPKAQLGDPASATLDFTARFEQRPDGPKLAEGELTLRARHQAAMNWKVALPDAKRLQIQHGVVIVDGKEVIEIKGELNGLADHPRFQLRISTPPLQRAWLEGLLPELKEIYAAHPAPWTQIACSALLAGDAEYLDIRDLLLRLDKELAQISGSVRYQQPDIRLRITARSLHLDPWLPKPAQAKPAPAPEASAAPQQTDPEGASQPQAPAEPDLRFLKPWRITAKILADQVSVHGLEMKNLQANLSGRDGVFRLNPLRFDLAGGSVTETASLDATVYPARWQESLHMTGVNIGPVLRSLADIDLFEGILDMDTSLKASGLTQAAVTSLNGGAKVLLRNGLVRGLDIVGALRRFADPSAAGSGPTDFTQLSASFELHNGVARNEDLFMASPLLRMNGRGTVDLVNKQLDYHVKPRIVGALPGKGGVLRKGLTVPLHIVGPWSAPTIKPEINAKTLIENAPALLQKQGGVREKLGSLLGGRSESSGEATPKQHTPPSPQKKLRDAVGGLLQGL